MNKLSNKQSDFLTDFRNFLKKSILKLRKTQLNIIPYIILGMIISESCISIDIAKSLKYDFSSIQIDSFLTNYLISMFFTIN